MHHYADQLRGRAGPLVTTGAIAHRSWWRGHGQWVSSLIWAPGSRLPRYPPSANACLPMVHRLCILDTLDVAVAGPHPDLLAADKPVVADPHDWFLAERRAAGALVVVDHPPTPAALGERRPRRSAEGSSPFVEMPIEEVPVAVGQALRSGRIGEAVPTDPKPQMEAEPRFLHS